MYGFINIIAVTNNWNVILKHTQSLLRVIKSRHLHCSHRRFHRIKKVLKIALLTSPSDLFCFDPCACVLRSDDNISHSEQNRIAWLAAYYENINRKNLSLTQRHIHWYAKFNRLTSERACRCEQLRGKMMDLIFLFTHIRSRCEWMTNAKLLFNRCVRAYVRQPMFELVVQCVLTLRREKEVQ